MLSFIDTERRTTTAAPKTKVAILGGGIGAMTVAWELSSGANRDKYDITVYQMGWRLGGQGASGRNQSLWSRIEEHGLHAWGGFYENAFRIMGEVYAELGRPAGKPLARLWDPDNPGATDVAFKPHDDVVFCEYVEHKWIPWPVEFPRESGLPGQKGNQIPSLQDMLYRAIEIFLSIFKGVLPSVPAAWTENAIKDCLDLADRLAKWTGLEKKPATAPYGELDGIIAGLRQAVATVAPELHNKVFEDIVGFLNSAWEKFVKTDPLHMIEVDDRIRRLVILLDFMRVMIAGVVEDGVLTDGFSCIEKYDFREWLQRHGAMQITLDSVIVRGFYDYLFAFVQGDPGRPSLSAGTALWHAIRLTLTYRYAIFFHMEAGMGDTVFAPFYLAMKKRNVKFKFFHRVDDIVAAPAADGAGRPKIASIKLTKQVKLNPEKCPDDEYQPLISVLDLPCWPSQPLGDQIVNGADLLEKISTHDVDLEVPNVSGEKQWPDEEQITLSAGADFDIVVSNISVAALAYADAGLVSVNPSIALMVGMIKTVPTMAVQIWMTKTVKELGWTAGNPILTGYARPTSTWGDMTYLIGREMSGHLGADLSPKSLAYFCGPLCDVDVNNDQAFSTGEGRRAFEGRVKATARQWFQDNAWQLFPNATIATNPTALDYSFLWFPILPFFEGPPVVPPAIIVYDYGLMRFDNQYTRGNIKPCERYVMSSPDDAQYRPREGESGIDGLYFVGDWIYTALGGCVESAAMAGLTVVRRITGQEIDIIGELPETRLGFKPPPHA